MIIINTKITFKELKELKLEDIFYDEELKDIMNFAKKNKLYPQGFIAGTMLEKIGKLNESIQLQ